MPPASESDAMTPGRGGERATPPGPRTLPFVGTAPAFARDPFGFREECARKYGDVVDISALGRRAYLLTHPDDVERVLLSEQDRYVKPSFEMRFVDDVFGRGLSFLDGEEWRRRRKVLQPSFYRERVAAYGPVMTRCVEETVAGWEDGQEIRLDEEMTTLTLRVLSRTLFGLDLTDEVPDLLSAFRGVNDRHRVPQVILPRWLPSRSNRRYRAGLAKLEATIDDLIERRREDVDGGVDGSTDDDRERQDDLLAALLRATESEDALSDETLRDELMGFLFAGHETTAVALTFANVLLSANPEVRNRLVADLRSAVGGGRPDPVALESVPLLDRVVDETLRLYPPSHSVARETAEDVTLGGYRVPAGSSVHLPQWVVHRDERWYDDPGTFDPDRWTASRSEGRPDYAFFPFGGGPRRCIGARFARLELRLALSTLLTSATVEVADHDPDLEAGLTLRPAGEVEATVRMQEGRSGG